MPSKFIITIVGCLLMGLVADCQTTPPEVVAEDSSLAMDTSMDFDDLLDEFDSFIDSLQSPRSYFLVNGALSYGYYDFSTKNNTDLSTFKKSIISPAIGYYHKKGPGISIAGSMIDDGKQLNLYQYSVTPSFDFIQNKNWIGGFSYTRYFTKDSLPFYTTPLQNEVNGYFIYRKSWLQPGLSAQYGWGSRTDLEKRKKFIRIKRIRRLRRLGILVTTTTVTDENIADFSVTGSVRHNFYWLHLFSQKDYLRLTPVLCFSAGTQQYGFNQQTGTVAFTARNTGGTVLSSGNANLDDKMKFQPLSLTLSLKPEYCIGKFFIQPQVILDYYFPDAGKQLTFLYSINAGFML